MWSVCLSPRAPVLDRLSPFMGLFRPKPSLATAFIKAAHLARDSGGVMDVAGVWCGMAPNTS